MKYWILGFGEVAKAFLNILKKEKMFNASEFFCIEKSESKRTEFVNLGGIFKNFYSLEITQCSLKKDLSIINTGDFCIDFSSNINTKALLEFCLNRGIHYLCTADTFWKQEEEDFGKSFIEYLKLKEKYSTNSPTCIIEFGMNPGLVSVYAKKCIRMLVNSSDLSFIADKREYLQKKLNQKQFNQIAEELEIESIKICDYDTQTVSFPLNSGIIYSTWNVDAFYNEATSCPEVPFECPVKDKNLKLIITNKSMNYRKYNVPGYLCNDSFFCPAGKINGYIITHEETFTLSHFFTIYSKGKIKYRPKVSFIYHPCEASIKSLINLNTAKKEYNGYFITKNDIINGGEYVGINIEGKKIHNCFLGNYCNNNDFNCNNTIFQVAVACYAAFDYIIRNPRIGLLFPEDIDDSIIDITEKYLPIEYNFD